MRLENSLYQDDLAAACGLPLPWEKLRGKTVMMTGASGTIGTFLADVLMEKNRTEGLDITFLAVGRNEARAKERFAPYWESPLFRFISHVVSTPWTEEATPDYIIHAAGNSHPRAFSQDPVGTITSNVFGLYYLLNLASARRAERVLFLSSGEIYGQNRYQADSFSEGEMGYIDCNTLRAGYPESKRVAESLCQAYIKAEGLDTVTARLCRIYGPTMPENDSKVFAQFAKNTLRGENIVLKSAGTQYFSYCYAADAVSALLTILLCGKTGEAYNVADPNSSITLKDLAQLFADTSGTAVVFELPDEVERLGFSVADRAVLNTEKLEQLGWRARVGIRDGVSRTIEILK